MGKEQTIKSYMIQNTLDMQKIVDEYYNYISKIIKNNNIFNIEDEEEIISDVFLIIWKNQKRLNQELNFSPYIAGITKKVIYRKYKQLSKNIEITSYEENIIDKFGIDKIIEEKEINELIISQVKHIGEIEYKIFIKFYYEGKKVKDIAKELNLSVSNVKTKLHRTREKVKKILEIGGFNNE